MDVGTIAKYITSSYIFHLIPIFFICLSFVDLIDGNLKSVLNLCGGLKKRFEVNNFQYNAIICQYNPPPNTYTFYSL